MHLVLYDRDGTEHGSYALEGGRAVASNADAEWFAGIVRERPEQGETFIRALARAWRYSRLVES